MVVERKCSVCRVTLDVANKEKRCRQCATTSVKLSRALSGYSESFVSDWKEAEKQPTFDRQAFYKNANGLLAEDLGKLVEEAVAEHTQSTSHVELVGTGDFIDEADLKERYKNKPQRLEGIIQHTRRMVCPISGCELFEDMIFKSQQRESCTRKREHHIRATTENKLRKTKTDTKPKAAPAAIINQGEAKEFTENQLKLLIKQIAAATQEKGTVCFLLPMLEIAKGTRNTT